MPFLLVIRLGGWRRQFTVTTTCGANTVNIHDMVPGTLRLPTLSHVAGIH